MFKNNKRKQQVNSLGEQKVFKNVPHQAEFQKVKNWSGTVTTPDGKSYLLQYENSVRSEAVEHFENQARLIGGVLDNFIGTLKK